MKREREKQKGREEENKGDRYDRILRINGYETCKRERENYYYYSFFDVKTNLHHSCMVEREEYKNEK